MQRLASLLRSPFSFLFARPSDEPRRDDYLFEGYELDDALDAANGALEDDLTVSESDGRPENLKPFTRGELLKPLERWFFGHR